MDVIDEVSILVFGNDRRLEGLRIQDEVVIVKVSLIGIGDDVDILEGHGGGDKLGSEFSHVDDIFSTVLGHADIGEGEFIALDSLVDDAVHIRANLRVVEENHIIDIEFCLLIHLLGHDKVECLNLIFAFEELLVFLVLLGHGVCQDNIKSVAEEIDILSGELEDQLNQYNEQENKNENP